MNTPKDGGNYQNMSLRDYFAGQALQGELACQSSDTGEWADTHFTKLSTRCYQIADVMLAEREKGTP